MGKTRACGDLKYGCVDAACATRTAIMLPTWGHIGKICIDVADTNRNWPFFKLGHKAAYKTFRLIRVRRTLALRRLAIHRADYGADSAPHTPSLLGRYQQY